MLRSEMYTNGEYLRNNPDWDEKDAVHKVNWLNTLVTRNSLELKDVVEVGCGSGGILLELAKLYPHHELFTGYDISPQAIEIAKKNSAERIQFVSGNFLENTSPHAHTLLLFDVIEHVEDYYGFLSKLKGRADHFIFHIPLDLSCRTIFKPHVLLQQRNAVGHIHYFTRQMVLWMLKDTGYTVTDWIYTKPITDITPSQGIKSGIKKMLRKASFSISKNMSVDLWGNYSMMILAK